MNVSIIAIIIYFCISLSKSDSPSCITPNEEDASCVPLWSCPVLKAAADTELPSYTKFVEASKCGNSDSMVCCGSDITFNKNYVIKHLLPNKAHCGMQHTDDYFYNATATSVDEFPWMVYLPLAANTRGDPILEIRCAGVLINEHYVLTKNDCAPKSSDSVMIGQYDLRQTISCLETDYGPDCHELSNRIRIAEKNRVGENLLLLRLEDSVTYTDYIRPICLPVDNSDRPKKGDTILVSGWGEETFGKKTINTKKRIKNTLLGEDDCKTYNDKNECPFKSPLCISTEKNSSDLICRGDDGGPLMYRDARNSWFVEGIFTDWTQGCFTTEEIIRGESIHGALDDILEHMYP